MEVNVSTIRGSGEVLSLHVFKLYEGQEFSIPDNSQVLYRSIVSLEEGPEYLELWVGIPKESISRTNSKPAARQKEQGSQSLTVASNPLQNLDSFVPPEEPDQDKSTSGGPMFRREEE